MYVGGVWPSGCLGISTRTYHQVAISHIWPLLNAELLACIAAPDEFADAADVLTVHFRGVDEWGMGEGELIPKSKLDLAAHGHHWLWQIPPCGMYQKILEEDGYRKVLVVTSPNLRHPCVQWFQERASRAPRDLEVRVQATILLNDTCRMLKARNICLSFSTFPEALAILSQNVRKNYGRSERQVNAVNCGMPPGVSYQT